MCQRDKLKFLQTVKILMDTNVFIAYTRSSVVSTGHIQGLINKTKSEKGDSTTLPDGTKTGTEIISYLRGTVCDNQGNCQR